LKHRAKAIDHSIFSIYIAKTNTYVTLSIKKFFQYVTLSKAKRKRPKRYGHAHYLIAAPSNKAPTSLQNPKLFRFAQQDKSFGFCQN
jgi:hypothetical protein